MHPMSLIRVLWRAPVALAWTLSLHWWLLLRRLLWPRRWGEAYGTDIIGRWGAGLAWIMGVRLVFRNQRTGPMGDVLISNHMGFLDVPVLLAIFPAVFIIKAEMLKAPYFGNALKKHHHVFVERGSEASRRSAREGVQRVLEAGERLIVFPEGRASPGAERRPFKPFCFFEAQRQGKVIEAVVIDYLPDRRQLEWDIHRGMIPQLIELVGRRRTEVSVEFLGTFVPEDPAADAERWKDVVQGKLEEYDR
ncbi:MAG: lysophospholipid acyltransferase family protein [Pseudomonadota bacterium]